MIGAVIGSYRIIRELGVGGMGVVYLAQHTVIGRLAAIKLLLPEYSVSAEMIGRIFNEARMTALIKHPGLVDVYDFGRLPDGRAYLVMEYLEGETLASMIARVRRLPAELAVGIARQIAAAVGAAHGKGIVHRDLKPDNVFIVADEEAALGARARILDFGIAKLAPELTGGGGLHTRTGSILGTPAYMAPEQCRGTGRIDARADVYALGCILFEMLTGRRLFDFEGMGEIIAAHLHTAPDPPSRVEPSVPAWVDAVVLRALAKSPDERIGSMEQLVAALGGRAKTTVPPIVARTREPSAPKVVTTLGRTAGEVVPPRAAGRRVWVFMAAALVMIGGIVVAWRSADEPKPAAAPVSTIVPDAAPPLNVPLPLPPPVNVPLPDAGPIAVVAPDAGTVVDSAAKPPPPPKKKPPPPPKKRRDTMDPFQ